MLRELLPIFSLDSVNLARMILKTLNLATILVVVWLLWQQAGMRHEQFALHQAQAGYQGAMSSVQNTVASLEKRQSTLETKVNEVPPAIAAATPANPNHNAEINGLKAEIANYKGQVERLNKTSELKQTIDTVTDAELSKYDDPSSAAEKLLSTKEVIWRTSTEHDAVRQTLQSLMAPIDILAGEWNEGHTDNSVGAIHSVLTRAITVLESEGTTQR